MTDAPTHSPIRSFGRIKSRAIKPRQGALMQTLLPTIAIDLAAPPLGEDETWLEIGFGGGEHLAEQAARHPQARFLGAEPFLNGAASALRHIDKAGLANVRLHVGDARDLLAALPDASIARLFLMFPDPWPKARHRKRRLLNAETVTEFGRVLRPGAPFRFATDWGDYADRGLETVLASGLFDWPARRADNWRLPPADHVTTRYEEKRLGDVAPVFLDFLRR